MKDHLQDNDTVTNEVAGQAYVENFALNVFKLADDEDRAAKATRSVLLFLDVYSRNTQQRSQGKENKTSTKHTTCTLPSWISTVLTNLGLVRRLRI